MRGLKKLKKVFKTIRKNRKNKKKLVLITNLLVNMKNPILEIPLVMAWIIKKLKSNFKKLISWRKCLRIRRINFMVLEILSGSVRSNKKSNKKKLKSKPRLSKIKKRNLKEKTYISRVWKTLSKNTKRNKKNYKKKIRHSKLKMKNCFKRIKESGNQCSAKKMAKINRKSQQKIQLRIISKKRRQSLKLTSSLRKNHLTQSAQIKTLMKSTMMRKVKLIRPSIHCTGLRCASLSKKEVFVQIKTAVLRTMLNNWEKSRIIWSIEMNIYEN